MRKLFYRKSSLFSRGNEKTYMIQSSVELAEVLQSLTTVGTPSFVSSFCSPQKSRWYLHAALI